MDEKERAEALERSFDITLQVLGDAMDLKCCDLERHCRRVCAFAIIISRTMHLPKDEVNIIARAAFLHDVGKIGIPDDVLLKPAKLNSHEMRIMQEHCYLGYRMICRIPFLSGAAEIVYSHHERVDGTGYPRALKGTKIPLGARIVSVAGTLDIITSNGPYHKAQTLEAARQEIERCSGSQFDSEAVKAFMSIKESDWDNLRNNLPQSER